MEAYIQDYNGKEDMFLNPILMEEKVTIYYKNL